MIQLTFVHSRDVFVGTKFKSWIYELFPKARFDSCMWGQWYPTIKIPYDQFRENYKNIPSTAQNKIAGIKCDPSFLACLAYDIRPVNKITNLHPDFEKYTGRENYGKVVEEIIAI